MLASSSRWPRADGSPSARSRGSLFIATTSPMELDVFENGTRLTTTDTIGVDLLQDIGSSYVCPVAPLWNWLTVRPVGT